MESAKPVHEVIGPSSAALLEPTVAEAPGWIGAEESQARAGQAQKGETRGRHGRKSPRGASRPDR